MPAVVAGVLVAHAPAALADPVDLGCHDADIRVYVNGVGCAGIHYPEIEKAIAD